MHDLADKQLIAMREKYGDEKANHLGKVGMALAQYLVTRTETQDEGLDVIINIKDSLELAIKLDKESSANKPNDPQTN